MSPNAAPVLLLLLLLLRPSLKAQLPARRSRCAPGLCPLQAPPKVRHNSHRCGMILGGCLPVTAAGPSAEDFSSVRGNNPPVAPHCGGGCGAAPVCHCCHLSRVTTSRHACLGILIQGSLGPITMAADAKWRFCIKAHRASEPL